MPLRELEKMGCVLAVEKTCDLAGQGGREIAGRVELQVHFAKNPASFGATPETSPARGSAKQRARIPGAVSKVSQIPKPLLHRRLVSLIQIEGIATHKLSQQEDDEFVHAAERAAKSLFRGNAQIRRKPDFTQFAHD
jgi:hypothetical protein